LPAKLAMTLRLITDIRLPADSDGGQSGVAWPADTAITRNQDMRHPVEK